MKDQICGEVMQRIHEEKLKWKRRFDAAHRHPRNFSEGDLVAIERVPGPTGMSHKLEPAYRGPYIVTKVLSNDRYLVEDLPDAPRTSRRYSGVLTPEHMKPWCVLGPEADWVDELEEEPEPLRSNELSGKAELSDTNADAFE